MAQQFNFSGCLSIFIFCLWLTIAAERDFQFENNGSNDDVQLMLTELPEESNKSGMQKNLYSKELAQCPYTESKIMLSLVLKSHDWNDIVENKKTRAINKLSKFFAIPKEFIKLETVSKRDIYEMSKRSIKRGRNRSDSDIILGSVEFMIGCGQKYFTIGEPISNQIGQQMKDGSIDDITGINFGWWAIWKKKISNRVQRYKRELEEGSGEDDYIYDYDEDDDESITELPTETTHAHRHHHGIPKSESLDDEQIEHEKVLDQQNRTSTTTSRIATTTILSKQFHVYDEIDENVSEISTILPETTITTTTQLPTIMTSTLINHFENTILPTLQSVTQPTTTTTTTILSLLPTTSMTTTSLPTTTVPTTTIVPVKPTTEYIELEMKNTSPMIKNRLPKQPVTAGKPFSLLVPLETFYDDQDGTNLRLELLDKNDHSIKMNSWIQFNEKTREIYGLPLEDAVSRYQYKLYAFDSHNLNTSETLDISVQQHKGHRSVNHEISINIKLNKKYKNNIDWQIRLIRGIIETLNDNSMSSVVVREIRQNQQDPYLATFIYTNETLPKDKCPEDKLNELIKRLDMKKLTDSLHPEIIIKSVSGQLIGQCQKMNLIKTKPTPHMTKNYPPVPRNQVDRVNATIGHLLIYPVPVDTFYDPEDNTDLKLSLLTMNRKPLDPRHWLQFDSKNQEFYGIPKYGDYGPGEYLLVAEDHEGLQASDALEVVVNPPTRRDYSVLFKITLGITYEQFNNSLLQRRFFERIALLFGEQSTTNIQLRALHSLNDTGNIMIMLYNTSLYRHQKCPEEEIESIRNVWLNENSNVRDSVKAKIGTEFNLLNVYIQHIGVCTAPMETVFHEHIPVNKPEDKKPSSFKDDYLLTFVLPAIIILAMLLLASIIACVLHRRRLTGKMELGDEEERRSFRSKGIPVIFQDELDEKPEIGNKSPIILKDEKPPLLPPSYNSTNLDGDNDVDEYVPPPAVVMGGREVRGKSPVTPSYRKPPPYVSP